MIEKCLLDYRIYFNRMIVVENITPCTVIITTSINEGVKEGRTTAP